MQQLKCHAAGKKTETSDLISVYDAKPTDLKQVAHSIKSA